MEFIKDYELWKDAMAAMPKSKVEDPKTPIEVLTANAETLHVEAIKDKDRLIAAGLDAQRIENLPTKAGALRYTESMWQSEFDSRQESQKQWLVEAPKGSEMVAQLLHDLSFAYRNDPTLEKAIKRIRKGNGHKDMIQDLLDIAVLAERNPEPLTAINFNMDLIPKARTQAHLLIELLANSNGDKDQNNEAKLLRDKAYTLLMEDIKAIREVGQYVFWRDPARKEKYTDLYRN